MKSNIIETIVRGERIFLKKSSLTNNYKVVYPIIIDEKINWKHLITGGSWWNLVKVAVIVFLILGAVSEYQTAVNMLNSCLENQIKIVW